MADLALAMVTLSCNAEQIARERGSWGGGGHPEEPRSDSRCGYAHITSLASLAGLPGSTSTCLLLFCYSIGTEQVPITFYAEQLLELVAIHTVLHLEHARIGGQSGRNVASQKNQGNQSTSLRSPIPSRASSDVLCMSSIIVPSGSAYTANGKPRSINQQPEPPATETD